MPKHTIQTSLAPAAIGPYSQAVEANGFLFCSGQIALNPKTGELVGETVTEQTQQVLLNLKAVLNAADLTFENVVKTTIYLTDINDFAAVNLVYGEFFGTSKPARATVAVAALPRDAKVEIEAMAAK